MTQPILGACFQFVEGRIGRILYGPIGLASAGLQLPVCLKTLTRYE